MSNVADTEHPTDDGNSALQTADPAENGGEAEEYKMALEVAIETVGPCKKHVRVTVPREGIDRIQQDAVSELMVSAEVPGFRKGFAPEKLIERRFKDEIGEQVKQKVLMHSLEQLADEQDLDPINEPNIDIESIDIPEEGDFEYEFDVEVRPEFDLPNYKGLKIERPVREITDADVDAYELEFLEQYGHQEPTDDAAALGDYVIVSATFASKDKVVRKFDELSLRVRPTLRFQDAEIDGFDELMIGAKPDDVRETELTISIEANNIEMRGEPVRATFKVLDIKRLVMPELDDKFFERIGVSDAEQLKNEIRNMLERQTTYQQRQTTREQVLNQITASADWDLPEDLVRKQTENALRREILEMRQAGFTSREIQARENDLRQRSISMTRQNLKEHFVLDRIAEEEGIEVTPSEIDMEIAIMAMQAGENPRRVRARLQKSGMIENLDAQIRERKAVDVIIEHAQFEDVEMDPPTDRDIEAVSRSICGSETDTEVEAESADEAAES
ncbi:MAG: trigger factor [Planctomycetaceae bacterium]|nr:trigger factor [Planctomycetaceae bacterium]